MMEIEWFIRHPSRFSEFLLQLPNNIADEIAEAPADALGDLLNSRQPLTELWIQVP